jgi:hypothetical protein
MASSLRVPVAFLATFLAPAVAAAQAAPAPIQVPVGCTAITQPSGQVTISCAAAPSAPPPPPQVVLQPQTAPPAPTTDVAPVSERKWYGWQTLIVDGAVLVASVAIAPVSSDGAAATFLVGNSLGGPIVHWSNGQVGKGFASLGLRVGAPLVVAGTGAVIALAAGGCHAHDCPAPAIGAGVGLLLGYVTAIVIDAAVIARKTVQVAPDGQRAGTRTINWSPTAGYDSKRQQLSVGIGGTF